MLSSSSSSSFYMRRNDNHSSSNNKKTVNELVKKASKQALTIAHNRHLDKQHVKINLYISRMRRIPFVFKRSLINISRSCVMLCLLYSCRCSRATTTTQILLYHSRALSLSLSLSLLRTHTHTHSGLRGHGCERTFCWTPIPAAESVANVILYRLRHTHTQLKAGNSVGHVSRPVTGHGMGSPGQRFRSGPVGSVVKLLTRFQRWTYTH